MSRSRKKINISGITCCESEKKDKQIANRRFRRNTKQAVAIGFEVLPIKKEISNVWDFGKDGKQFNTNPLYLRK